MLRSYRDLYRDTLNPQVSAEICLDEHTHRPAAPFSWQLPARRPDSAFPSERHGPAARADRALLHWPGHRELNRVQHIRLGDRSSADVVQKTVIGLTHHRIRRPDVLVARTAQ